jgi:8-oxo-dGTP diphosphatase
MKKEKFKMPVAVFLVLIRDGNVLLSRRFNTGYADGKYSMVAGHVDGSETIAHAVAREAKEETGIDVIEEDLRVVHTQHRAFPGGEYIDFYLTTEKWQGEPRVMEHDKCDDISWHKLDSLPENTLPYISLSLEHIRDGVAFSEFSEE